MSEEEHYVGIDILVESMIREYLSRAEGAKMKAVKQIFESEKVRYLPSVNVEL